MISARDVIAATIRQHCYSSTLQEQAHAIIRALDAAGYAVVPKEATRQMELVGYAALTDGLQRDEYVQHENVSEMWRAMVALEAEKIKGPSS